MIRSSIGVVSLAIIVWVGLSRDTTAYQLTSARLRELTVTEFLGFAEDGQSIAFTAQADGCRISLDQRCVLYRCMVMVIESIPPAVLEFPRLFAAASDPCDRVPLQVADSFVELRISDKREGELAMAKTGYYANTTGRYAIINREQDDREAACVWDRVKHCRCSIGQYRMQILPDITVPIFERRTNCMSTTDSELPKDTPRSDPQLTIYWERSGQRIAYIGFDGKLHLKPIAGLIRVGLQADIGTSFLTSIAFRKLERSGFQPVVVDTGYPTDQTRVFYRHKIFLDYLSDIAQAMSLDSQTIVEQKQPEIPDAWDLLIVLSTRDGQ